MSLQSCSVKLLLPTVLEEAETEENDTDSESQYCNTAEKLLDILINILSDLPVR